MQIGSLLKRQFKVENGAWHHVRKQLEKQLEQQQLQLQ
jgi:hypothetical protein